MGDVALIHGGPAPDNRSPNEHLIRELERMLQMAKSGEAQGMGFVTLYSDRSSSYQTAGVIGGYSILGASAVLQAKILEHVTDED